MPVLSSNSFRVGCSFLFLSSTSMYWTQFEKLTILSTSDLSWAAATPPGSWLVPSVPQDDSRLPPASATPPTPRACRTPRRDRPVGRNPGVAGRSKLRLLIYGPPGIGRKASVATDDPVIPTLAGQGIPS